MITHTEKPANVMSLRIRTGPGREGKLIDRTSSLALRVSLFFAICGASILAEQPWPPELPGARNDTVTLRSDAFLRVPEAVEEARSEDGYAPFVMAKTPPTVDLALHRDLGDDAVNRRLWSSWGDICVASDGKVYCGIGDHGNAVGGDARCFIYRWDPKAKTLMQVVDMNKVVPPRDGQPAWSKVHAKIDEGRDGNIYFCATLNDGNRAKLPKYKWNDRLPGGQLYQYDPKSQKTTVYANLPPRRCTATSILDRGRNVWWCNLEAGEGNALWGLNLTTKKPVYQSDDGVITFNRNFALAQDGSIYFNGKDGIWQIDAERNKAKSTGVTISDSPGMRASTRQSRRGEFFGVTYRTNQLFRYEPATSKVELLGPTWATGQYTTVAVLSPDERFVYYLPGSHGKASNYGTPVIQYEIASGTRKVLAFLAPAIAEKFNYVPGGTYGVKLNSDGTIIYVNFNGHAGDGLRPSHMRPNGFGLCAFAAIHIPKKEIAEH